MMHITCSGCGKQYRIPEEKLPKSGVAYITCPQCKEKIKVEAPVHSPVQTPSPSVAETGKHSLAEGFERFEPGTKTALLYCPEKDAREQLESVLDNMGYKIRTAKGPEDVAIRFKYHTYDVVFLFQKGPDPEKTLQEILEVLNALEMDIRRKVIVVYIHLSGNRFDTLQSFFLSADLTINPLDIPRLPDILPEAIEAKSVLYSAFYDTKAALQEEAL